MPTAPETSASCKVVLAGDVARSLLAEVAGGRQKLVHRPHLLGVLANADPAAKLYAKWTEKTCREK